MFNQRTDIALEGPNPFVRKIGNRFFHQDQIPRALRFNDQRRDREVLDNLRAQGVPIGPIVPLADPSNATHVGISGGATQKQISAVQGPIVPAQYAGAQYGAEQLGNGGALQYVGNPYQQPYAPTVSPFVLGSYPAYGYAAGSPYGYNAPILGSSGLLSTPVSVASPIGAPVIAPTITGAPGFGGLY